MLFEFSATKRDYTAVDIMISDFQKKGRAMDTHIFFFDLTAETLVKLGSTSHKILS